jgi:hypothetical protein
MNYRLNTYTYDGNNNWIVWLWQDWDGTNWLNNWKQTYTYAGDKLIEALSQDWNNSNWANYEKFTYTYNGNNVIETLYQTWGASNWVNDWKRTYEYDTNNNIVQELELDWVNSDWENDWKYTYAYDGNNRIGWLWQNWDGSDWVNYLKSSNTFDANDNVIETIQQEWDGSDWINDEKDTYLYIPTGIEHFEGEVNTFSLLQNYPNPFNPNTKISWQAPVGIHQTLKIYDVLGNKVATLIDEYKPAGTFEVEFDASGLPSGIYFYQLKTENITETKKMILMK